MSVAGSIASKVACPVCKSPLSFSINSGYAPLTGLALDGFSPVLAVSPQYLGGTGNGQAWADARYPTVKVEKGYGTAVYQDLYPDPTTGELFTGPSGTGQTATAYAGSSKLFVEVPYNQALSGPLASGHPSVVTDASRRVMLDISTPTAPAFAGLNQGTQDASQSATERGYDSNINVVSNVGLQVISLDNAPSGVTTAYRTWQNNGGQTQYMDIQPANPRWFPATSTAVATVPTGSRYLPAARVQFANANGYRSTNDTGFAIHGGSVHEIVDAITINATSTPLRLFGPTSPLTGRCFSIIALQEYSAQSTFKYSGNLIKRLHKACKAVYGANEITLYSPIPYQVFKMNLGTSLGSIRINLASGANREIEASFNGGAYSSIGTTDENGYLSGTLSSQSPGTGTLNVRVVGQASAAVSVSNVRVGIIVARGGQSNADERGNDVTLTVARSLIGGYSSVGGVSNTTATRKSWIWALLQDLGTTYSCPVAMAGWSAGSTYLYFDAAGSSDGRHGHWNASNPGSSTNNDLNRFIHYLSLLEDEPNFVIWHQGENDAMDGISQANYKAALVAMWAKVQLQLGWTCKLHVMSIGRNNPVADANTNAIRYAQQQAWDDNSSTILPGGCLSHLACGDGATDEVHFWTQAQKDAVVAVFKRHALGSGRGPRFSSMVASGTTITIQCTGGVTPLTISGGEAASPIGWTVTDGGGSKTVTAVAVSNLQITLTVNSSLSGTVTVKWLSGDDGIGTTLLDSDGTTPVPPEPFSQSVAAL